MTFPDYFSEVAAKYVRFRPRYSAALVDSLAALVSPQVAWDIGCGNGQLSTVLGERFERVIATDPSQQQLDLAEPHPRVEYRCATAEASGLPDASVDLAVAAQAAHWFDWSRFVVEVGRVTKPGGVVALVAYGGMYIEDGRDPAIRRYKDVVEPYWPDRRRHIDNGYRELTLPWPAIESPVMDLEAMWDRDQLLGYVSSWSSTSAYIKQHGTGVFERLRDELADDWADGERRYISWPLVIKIARR